MVRGCSAVRGVAWGDGEEGGEVVVKWWGGGGEVVGRWWGGRRGGRWAGAAAHAQGEELILEPVGPVKVAPPTELVSL